MSGIKCLVYFVLCLVSKEVPISIFENTVVSIAEFDIVIIRFFKRVRIFRLSGESTKSEIGIESDFLILISFQPNVTEL